MSLAKKALEQGKGIVRLAPTWVPRSFCVPGRRIKLHPDDYYREETFKKLEHLTTIKAGKEEVLDKKRKFLDDIPLRMNLVKASTADIKAQFDAYKNGLNSGEDEGDNPAVDGMDEDGIEIEVEAEADDDGAMKEDGEEDFETSNDAMDESNPVN